VLLDLSIYFRLGYIWLKISQTHLPANLFKDWLGMLVIKWDGDLITAYQIYTEIFILL